MQETLEFDDVCKGLWRGLCGVTVDYLSSKFAGTYSKGWTLHIPQGTLMQASTLCTANWRGNVYAVMISEMISNIFKEGMWFKALTPYMLIITDNAAWLQKCLTTVGWLWLGVRSPESLRYSIQLVWSSLCSCGGIPRPLYVKCLSAFFFSLLQPCCISFVDVSWCCFFMVVLWYPVGTLLIKLFFQFAFSCLLHCVSKRCHGCLAPSNGKVAVRRRPANMYICTYVRRYVHTCMHTYMHAYIRTYVRTPGRLCDSMPIQLPHHDNT